MSNTRAITPFWVRYDAKMSFVQFNSVTYQAELAHRRLADSVWATGRWPVLSNPSTRLIARATSKAWPGIIRELRSIGWHSHGPRLMNHDVARVMEEARAYRDGLSAAGKSGAKARWHRPESQSPPVAPAPLPASSGRVPQPHGDANGTANGTAITAATADANGKTMPVQNSNSTVPLAVNTVERLMRSVSPRKSSASVEKDFMEEVKETMDGFSPKFAGGELENWGGWWRNRFREKPDKARRVLAEIRSMVKEHRIQTNPGAAATDLWHRLP